MINPNLKNPTEKEQKLNDAFEMQVTYWRKNPHRFAVEFLKLNLHWWQQFVLWMMWHTGNTIFLASRGSGKTYLTMVYCICMACLFPGTSIRVAAASRKQAALLIAKVNELKRSSPQVMKEIINVSIGKDEAKITFKGGSEVETVVASDNARGQRCQVLIIDERVIVDKEIIDKIFIPFLTATRNPPYLSNPEYAYLKERELNHFIQLSSIGSKGDSLYKEFEQYIGFVGNGLIQDYSIFSLPYQVPMSSGVISRKTIEKMIRENTTSVEAFKQEMEVIPSGEGESSIFSFASMNNSRKIYVPLIPITDEEYIELNGNVKKYKFYQPKEKDEIRILSMDVASMGGRRNDASIFTVYRATKVDNEYVTEVSYIESINGQNIEPQVLRFKQLFYDLCCNFAVLDCGGVGQSFYDLCTKKTIDTVRNKKYDAWKSVNKIDEKWTERTLDSSAVPVLYVIKIAGASAPAENLNMVTKVRYMFEKKKIMLLLDEDDIVDELQKRYNYLLLKSSNNPKDVELAKRLILPFKETSELIKESMNTQTIKVASGLQIEEKTGRKDRTMSFLYGAFYISLLEQDLQVVEKKYNIEDYGKSTVSNTTINNGISPFASHFNRLTNSGFGRR